MMQPKPEIQQDTVTEAQSMRDAAMLDRIRRELIEPFLSDLFERFPQLADMTPVERSMFLYDDNVKTCKGIGDSARFYIRSDDWGPLPLWQLCIAYSGDADSSVPYHEIPSGIVERIKHQGRRCYHPCYTAALITQVIEADALTKSEIYSECFALGGEPPKSSRYRITPTYNSLYEITGYEVRIRDVPPSNDLMEAIATDLREESRFFTSGAHPVSHDSTDTRRRSKRARTDTMVAYIDNLIMQGRRPGSRTGESWDDTAAQLAIEIPDCTYRDGVSLQHAYYSAKKRRQPTPPAIPADVSDSNHGEDGGR